MLQPWEHWNWVASVTDTGSLTHWARPGIEPPSSERQHQVLNPLSHDGISENRKFLMNNWRQVHTKYCHYQSCNSSDRISKCLSIQSIQCTVIKFLSMTALGTTFLSLCLLSLYGPQLSISLYFRRVEFHDLKEKYTMTSPYYIFFFPQKKLESALGMREYGRCQNKSIHF